MAAACGTLAYVAPEVLQQSYTSQCDMWSFGVVVFIVLFGYMPFKGAEKQQMKAISSGDYTYKPAVWSQVSEIAQSFVKGLLVVDPKLRMTAEQALQHKFILEREKVQPAFLDDEIVGAMCNFGKESAFRRACMSMMAWSLTNSERAKVRNAFIELDVERTGTIKLSEFKQVLEKKFHMNDEQLVQVFKALDTNHTDEIHYSEFLAAMVSSRIAMHDDMLYATFKRFDTDNSGYITVENLKDVLGESFEGEKVAEMLKEADFTSDGKISLEEFMLYLKGGQASDTQEDAASRIIDAKLESMGEQGNFSLRMRMSSGSNEDVVNVKRKEPLGDGASVQHKCCEIQ